MSNDVRPLTRDQLKEFLPSPRAIRAFEQLLKQVSDLLPTDVQTILTLIDDSSMVAAAADFKANQCLSNLDRIAQALELIAGAPAPTPGSTPDDLTPPVVLGTISQQQSDNVVITGGTITAKLTTNQTTLLNSSVALTNGAGAAAGTLLNAPSAGNPTKWVPINDNGTTRYIPTW